MPRYPIGKQDFRSLREEGFLYIDKTYLIPRLLEGNQIYFLGRPRRFGKSLFLSTLDYFFRGERELFKGLAVESYSGWEWKKYPVIHIDFSWGNYTEDKSLSDRLHLIISQYEQDYGVNDSSEYSLPIRFDKLIRGMHANSGLPVVVLIDEYEKPITDALENESQKIKNQEILRGFYSVLKAGEKNLKFVFLTGITKFGQMNVFSSLNNINDITLDDDYCTICGITEEELTTNFIEGIEELGKKNGLDFEQTLKVLKDNYDGYHFSADCPDIYNPFSLLNAFSKKRIDYYWAWTGMPALLAKILYESNFDLEKLNGIESTATRMLAINSIYDDPVAIFFQAGYLTIKDYDPVLMEYTLGFPNREVEHSFLEYILPVYLNRSREQADSMARKFAKALISGQPEEAMQVMTSLSADITYDVSPKIETEKNFQRMLYVMCRFILPYNIDIKLEDRTSNGRIDMTVITEKYIYIIEIKRDKSAQEALAQIESKDYALKYTGFPQKKFLIGVNFSTHKRRIDEYLIKEIPGRSSSET